MSASSTTRALVICLAAPSASRSVTVVGPTRAGCGLISHCMATAGEELDDFEHPVMSRAAKQPKIRTTLPHCWSKTRLDSAGRRRAFLPLAGADGMSLFSDRREHMVIHAYDHGDGHDPVVEERGLPAWENQ